MAVLVGFEAKTFTFEEGKTVSGFYLHTEEKRNGVTGMSVERVFLSQQKLDGYGPRLGDDVTIYYNRFGKPQGVQHH